MALLGERKQRAITVTDLVFRVAPRINAAGRMKHGTYAVGLLLSETTEEASKRAEAIEAFNEDRKALDRDITEQALAQIEESGLQALTQPSLEPSLNLVFDSSETSYVNTGLTR